MIKSRLFTPGPVSMFPQALTAALDANIHHRTPEFKAILSDVVGALKRTLGNLEHVFLFTSSGTGAMESAVTNFFSAGDEVLVASCGRFGERWIELAQRFSLKTTVLKAEYGTAVQPDEVESALKANPSIRGVFIQGCESSTGVQNDVAAIGEVVRSTEALLIVDAVSALATMPLSPAMGIDVLLSGSQKALMIPPGLAFLGATQKAWSRVESATLPRYYFDLRAARKSWEKDGQTAFTPATSLVLSLQKSLQFLENAGLERLISLTANRAKATRAGLQAISVEPFAKHSPANALTAITAPGGAGEQITSMLKKRFGLHLAGGQGELKGKIIRISHMGYIDHFDILGALSALEITLQSMGNPVVLGRSLEAFQRVYAEVA